MLPAASVPRRVGVYLALTLALSSVFWILIIRAGALGAHGGAYIFGLMWSPAVAALVASLLTGRPLREIGWRWPAWRYIALGWGIPFAYAAVAYGATWLTGLGGFPNAKFVSALAARHGDTGASTASVLLPFLLIKGTLGVFLSCTSALGEEIGWRGFLVPELAKRISFTRVALVSGLIWSVWHYPVLLFADYNGGTPAWYGLACFTVLVVCISFLFAWIRLRSGSIWPAVLLHGSHNLFVQQVFDPLTSDTGRTKWVIGEFGAALAIVAIGVAFLSWRRAGALAPAAAAA